MSGITIPTLDEITGHTVMAKLRSLCKKFIGLAEEVNEKIDAPLEEAHQAVQTANATLATAQESLENANSAVTTANSASATATQASESAQESAETVAGYDTRLGAVELKVQTAEGNIVTIQGQITDLQTADGQNVKINNINQYAVGLTGNQDVSGIKTMVLNYGGNMLQFKGITADVTAGTYQGSIPRIAFVDKNNVQVAQIYTAILDNGSTALGIYVRKPNGNLKEVLLARGDQ